MRDRKRSEEAVPFFVVATENVAPKAVPFWGPHCAQTQARHWRTLSLLRAAVQALGVWQWHKIREAIVPTKADLALFNLDKACVPLSFLVMKGNVVAHLAQGVSVGNVRHRAGAA